MLYSYSAASGFHCSEEYLSGRNTCSAILKSQFMRTAIFLLVIMSN